MSPELLTLGMFGGLLVLIVMGVSLSFALGGVAVVFTLILNGPNGLFPIVSAVFGTMWSVLLAAVPLFIFIGVTLSRSRISRDLYQAFYLWSGRLNGGLLLGTANFAAVLSAMTGSCAASTLTTGKIGMPAMKTLGYERGFALGTIAAAGTLGIIIPPSITLIVIGMTTGISIGQLFMGGLIAGLLMLAAILGYVLMHAWRHPESAPAIGYRVPMIDKIKSLRSIFAPVTIIVVVLASIFLGLATPTEAAAVGAVTVLLAVALQGEVNFKFLRHVCFETAVTTGMVIWIVFGATAFVSVYSAAGGISFMQDFLTGLELSPWLLLILMQVVVLLLGMFLDPLGIILLVLPMYYPVVLQLGFDPMWFCIIFQMNLCIGYITPPFGYNIFYLKTISPEATIFELYRSVMPFVFLLILCSAILMAFPSILINGTAWLTAG